MFDMLTKCYADDYFMGWGGGGGGGEIGSAFIYMCVCV